MRESMLQYMLECSVLLTMLYGFYMLLLKSSTFYGSKRVFLLFTLAASCVFPLLKLPKLAAQPFVLPSIGAADHVHVSGVSRVATLEDIFFVFAAIGAGFFILRLLYQLLSLLRLKRGARKQQLCACTVYSTAKATSPFSFFACVFIQSDRYASDELAEIVAHERIHARLFHSVDILLYELAACLFWFNPSVWLLRREVKRNSEYQTDAQMLQLGFKPQHYQYTLLHVCTSQRIGSVVNGFNVNHLKNRIMMMNKQKSRRASLLRYVLLIPLVALAVFFISCKEGKPSANQGVSQQGAAEQSGNQSMVFDKLEHDFGTVRESNGDASTIFTFVNNSKEPLLIARVDTSCGCTTPEWTKEPVAPGEKGYIKAIYGAKGRVGAFEKSLTVHFNAGSVELKIKGKVVAE